MRARRAANGGGLRLLAVATLLLVISASVFADLLARPPMARGYSHARPLPGGGTESLVFPDPRALGVLVCSDWDAASSPEQRETFGPVTFSRYEYVDLPNVYGYRPVHIYCQQHGVESHWLNDQSARFSGTVVCPKGFNFDTAAPNPALGACIANGDIVLDQNLGCDPCGHNPGVGNPINPATGNKFQVETDYVGAGVFPLRYTRTYNSQASPASVWSSPYDRRLGIVQNPAQPIVYPAGFYWRFVGPYRVTPDDGPVAAALPAYARSTGPDGRDRYAVFQDGRWQLDGDQAGRLESTGSGWRYTNADDEVETYDAGRLVSLATRAGRVQTLAYDAAGRLSTVTDPTGRSLTFGYDAQGRRITLTDPAGGVTRYGYDGPGRLVTVTYPDSAVRRYLYEDARHPHALTGLVDENGQRFATWTYDSAGRAVSSEHAGGVERVTLTGYGVNGATTVTDARGTARAYTFQTVQGMAKLIGVNEPCTACGNVAYAFEYDANGNRSSQTDFNGIVTTYAYDLSRNLETRRTEAVRTPQARIVTTEWHPAFRLPIRIVEPGRTTTRAYDAAGNLVQRTVTDPATGAARTWTYTYDAGGRVLSEDGPRTDAADITRYGYDAQGNLVSVTNALGHITRITAYDAHGRPLAVEDPNGLVTRLAYDARGRLTARTVGSETTQYQYDAVGQLLRVTLPDGSFLTYTYDAAHRLTQIRDGAGNRIVYTLDALGNRVKEDVLDAAGALAQTRARVFSGLNRLAKDVGAAGQVTAYGYDGNGNVTSTTDPLNQKTTTTYDALNRLVQTLDPAGGSTRYGYDALDRVSAVTDPRGLVTRYILDGLDNRTRQDSPDTGTTTATFDAAGNALTRTDAKGQVTRYQYDALNRLTQASYADGQVEAFTYDSGTNGLGRLTGMTDSSGRSDFAYDAHGRLLSDARTVNGRQFVTQYRYDSAGRLAGMTYPSGLVVTLAYDAAGRVARLTGTGAIGVAVPLVDVLGYQPFGEAARLRFGNGIEDSYAFDADGRVSGYTLGPAARRLGFDAAGRLVTRADAADPAATRLYEYDALDRLTAERAAAGNQAFHYDAAGNRTQRAVDDPAGALGIALTDYRYAATSNRLLSLSGSQARSVATDANGSLTADGNAYTYDARGRLTSATGPGGTATYRLNGQGQRVQKTVTQGGTSTTTLFVYDNDGQLLGEYDGAGNAVQETVWLNTRPVATVRGGQVLAIQVDQLDTPRTLSDAAQRVVWRWEGDAFGVGAADEDPDGDATKVTYNLRFPGQYFDSETGRHYNYFRNYDPTTGRYIESDPIGLDGGINTYAYVGGNPLGFMDLLGLNPSLGARVGAAGGFTIGGPPGAAIGAIVGVVGGYLITDQLSSWIESRASGEEKLPIVDPGRDCEGNCNPCPPGKRWFVPKPGHGHKNGYWHTIVYNQDKRTCKCYPDRPSSGLDGF